MSKTKIEKKNNEKIEKEHFDFQLKIIAVKIISYEKYNFFPGK